MKISNLPGVMIHGRTKQDAVRLVKVLALRVLANTHIKTCNKKTS
jgi:hypothetical protein